VIQSTPNPAGAADSLLRGVSCTSARACVAVGTEVTPAGAILPLAERWNGRSWTLIPPAPGGPLAAVSCSSASACTAVGGSGSPLAERRNGSAWFFETPPNQSSSFNDLSAVSCPAPTACSAVGTYTDPVTGFTKTLGEFSPGIASWTLADTPSPGQTHSFLYGVSCATATSCTATGDFDDIKGIETTLGAFGAGTTLTFGATPTIPFENTFARGISCPTATECILVGFADNSAGTPGTVVRAGNRTIGPWRFPPVSRRRVTRGVVVGH
jgi:hypothetical protein